MNSTLIQIYFKKQGLQVKLKTSSYKNMSKLICGLGIKQKPFRITLDFIHSKTKLGLRTDLTTTVPTIRGGGGIHVVNHHIDTHINAFNSSNQNKYSLW